MTSVVAPTYYVPNSTYEYDEENRLTKVINSDARSKTTFFYDGDGGRTKKYTVKRQDIQVSSGATPLLQQKVWEFLVAVNPFSTKEAQAASVDHIITIATTNIYIGQTYEIVKETHQLPVAKKYIYLGPNRICSVENGEAYYYHTDHLNSSNIITDNTGAQQKRLEYMPYGGTSVESGTYSTNYRFTGKELDDETGLYFYGARYYNPVIGRFITPDSIVQAPQNPQTLNRYSYCVNNPVSYTDPTGHGLLSWLGDLFESIGDLFQSIGNWFQENFGHILNVVMAVAAIVTYPINPVGSTLVLASIITSYGPTEDWRKASRYLGYAALVWEVGRGICDWAFGQGEMIYPNGANGVPQDIVDKYNGNIFTNGIMTSQESAQAFATANNMPVFYNPSHGLIADLTESFLQKVTFTSSIDRQFASILGSIEGPVNIMAYSQGALTASNALIHLGNSGQTLAEGSKIFYSGAAISWARASLASSISGVTLASYASNFRDPINLIAPTLNPFIITTSVFGTVTSGLKYHSLHEYGY